MGNITKPLEELIRDLPPHLRVEVKTFVEFLLVKHERAGKHKLRQDWAGALKGHGYKAVELQHLASEWRDN